MMKTFLRPPGVLSEKEFAKHCILCGQCVQVCNFDCIVMEQDSFIPSKSTPRIYADKSPCYLCMKCSEICPTEALHDVTMAQAGMGEAHLDLQACVAYQETNGVMCWTCYEKCPLRGTALVLKNGYTATVTESCVGCGVCEYVCPTNAITVTPTRNILISNTGKKK